MQQSHKRHPFNFDVHVSADQEGKLQGFEALAMTDSGAYANMSPGVAFKAVSLGACSLCSSQCLLWGKGNLYK